MRSVFTRALLLATVHLCLVAAAFATCASPKNPIEAENCLSGNPSSQWLTTGAPGIQGFSTDISVNAGQTISFKISTSAASYTIDIYRLGYYQGLGARLVQSISPSVTLPQLQPTCLTDSSTGLVDCGNWVVSASWAVPTTAVSGVYFVKLTRPDTGEASPIVFVVRNDSSHSDILVQTSDPTWQAYNNYGGNSLYGASGNQQENSSVRAYKVSYNRPTTYGDFYSSEYPMNRWLEANAFDVTYFSGLDADRNAALITQHKIFLSVGHDEYWSAGQRSNVEAARTAGVHLAFFSGNEIFWKTRWEPSIDGSGTAYRTLVCYKESLAGAVIDPADPSIWTGMWRDPRFSPPADGGRPENALSGTLPWVSSPRNDSITVPQADGHMRFWRNTSIASLGPGQVATLPAGTLGPEWDIDQDNGFRPPGLFPLSTTTLTVSTCILGYTAIGACTATHHLTLYRSSSGALVFGAGTERWSWGLDSNNGATGTSTDLNMQQATVNLLADMGAPPATLQSGLVPAIASTDTTPPSSSVTSPAPGSTVAANSSVTVSGTAADSGGGAVAAVEVSVDGGNSWHPAQGRENWTYTYVPSNSGSLTIQSRAVDDSGNLEVPKPAVSLAVSAPSCPCTIWPATTMPNVADAGAYSSIELGVQFRSDAGGYISGIRFYKSAANTGTHVGSLWTSSGALLGTATFASETASGWQQVNFANPVAIAANTIYVASYHSTAGHFALDQNYFATSGVDNPPLHALPNGSSPNGVYSFAPSTTFPSNAFNASNFWVDTVFVNSVGPGSSLSVSTTSLPNGTQSVPYTQTLTVSGGTAPYAWALMSGSLPPSLSLSPAGQVSGTPSSAGAYNFTVQVTDSSSPAQTATQPLSITVVGQTSSQGNVQLNGTYAFRFSGMDGSGGTTSVFAAVGRFNADGAGNLINGELDTNGVVSGIAVNAQPFTGTYSIGADNRGVMTWNISGNSLRFAFAMTATGGAQFIEADASGGSGILASGTLEKVDTSAYSTTQIAGDYAFGISGLDGLNERATIIGRFTADGAGTLTNPAGDLDAYGSSASMNFTSSTYGLTDTTTGRGAMNLTFSFAGTPANLNFVFYIVNANKFFVMERDPVSSATPLLSGAVLRQQTPTGGFTNASLNAGSVISLTGQSLCGSTAPTPKTVVGLLSADGNGGFTLTYDENYCSAPNSVTAAPGTYTAATNGRAVLSVGGYTLIAYLLAQNQFFLFVADANVLFGLGQAQSAQPLSNASLSGLYAGFTVSPATYDVTAFSGEFTANGGSPSGNLSGTEDASASGGATPSDSFNATYSISASPTNGRGTMAVTSGIGGNVVLYMISPSQFVAISQTDPHPAIYFFEEAPTAVPAPVLASLTLSPTAVVGGVLSTVTVTLSGPAPNGGVAVNLSSSNTNAAAVPATVTVPVGATSATFTVTTNAMAASTDVVISASNGTTTQTATLTVLPAPSFTLSAAPSSFIIVQGTSGTSTITITAQNGFNNSVSLSASGLPSGVSASFSPNPAATTSTLTFSVSASATTGTFAITVTGTSGSLQKSTTIALTGAPKPLPTVSSLTLNPSSVVGGLLGSSTGTVTLSAPAPAGGALVQLSTNNGAAQVPSSVLVPAGSTSATFNVTTSIVLITTSAQISASYNSTTRTATLTVLL